MVWTVGNQGLLEGQPHPTGEQVIGTVVQAGWQDTMLHNVRSEGRTCTT